MSNFERPSLRERLAATASDVALDAVALCGAGLITYGAHLIYHPAGFIIGGVFCLGGAWISARKGA
jgi:hypothetical protein